MHVPVRPPAVLLALLLAATPALVARADDRHHGDGGVQFPATVHGDRGVREPHTPAAPPSPRSPAPPPDARTRYDRYRHDRYRHDRYVLPPPAFHPRGYRYDRLPGAHHRVEVHDRAYFYFDGMFLEPHLGAYVVVGAPLGARVPFLPAGYVSFFAGPRRYFYVNATYYLWEPDAYDYLVVEAPEGADEARATGSAEADGLFVYPARGQSDEGLAQDRFECHEWAVDQTGYDPTLAAPGSKGRADYLRAVTACLEGRGYTVR